jgi:sugar lactone lactonase YvrE
MKTLGLNFSAFGLCAAIVLAGCGQSQPATEAPPSSSFSPLATPIPPAPSGIRPPGWLARREKTPDGGSSPVIYVAAQSASEVLVYPEAGGSLMGEITDGLDSPYGLYVDKNGTLYVANEGNKTVTAYAAGSTSPSTTWSQDLDQPLYPIVDSSGDLFVSNRSNGTVVEYLSGSTAAYKVLQTPGTEADGMDFDSQGNLYVAYRMNDGKGKGGIEEFAPGATQGKVLGMKLNEPQGLIVDNSGNILVVVTGSADRIELFHPGHERRSQEIRAPENATLTQLAIEANESELFVSAIGGSVFTIAYPFPASGTLSRLLETYYSQVQGVALSNGQTF